VIKSNDANTFFGTELPFDLGIYAILKGNGNWDKNSLFDPIITKIIESGFYGIPWLYYVECDKTKPFFVIKSISGVHPERKNGKPLTSILKNTELYGIFKNSLFNGKTVEQVMSDDVHATVGKINNVKIVSEDTEIKAKNHFNFLQLTLFKYFVMKVTIDVNVYSQYMPYISSVENPRTHKMGYESDWTNEDLCKVFGITGFISDTEAEPGSEWETILETMKPYL
jgi:hypothetical protein